MIYVDDPYTEAQLHIALEYYLTSEKHLPTDCIFFLWDMQPTVIIGKYQNTLQEINLDYVKEHHINVARRLSGGGTVYADEGDYMYTFITPGDAGEISFTQYITPIVDALRRLGVDAGFNGRNDLVIGERKFSGNSQFKHNGYTVHHGTMLFDTDIEQMVRATTVDAYKVVSKGIASVRQRVTNISEHLPQPMTRRQFRQYMVDAICSARPCETYVLTEEDKARIEQIADEKFRPWEWNFGASPRCNLERSAHLPGGKVEWKLEVAHGRIAACALYGDFFCAMEVGDLCRALIGCPYREEDIRRVLDSSEISRRFYRITPEELLHSLI